jgi:hypothetical protein
MGAKSLNLCMAWTSQKLNKRRCALVERRTLMSKLFAGQAIACNLSS